MRHAGRTRGPFGAGEALRALQAILAGKTLGDIELIRCQDVDAKESVALQQREG